MLASVARRLSGVAILVALSACTDTGGTGVNAADPYEGINRKVHNFNKATDRYVLRPVSQAYGTVVPGEIRTSLHNGVKNLDAPGDFVNHVLQGDVDDAAVTFFRFGMNSTFGLAGLRDPATDAGLFARETDFGETMAVWGVREGAYIELPFIGPSTERDTAGRVVDYGINPIRYIFDPLTERWLAAANVFRINDRYEYRNLLDAILYESADSYTAARIAYLQNQALKGDGEVSEEMLVDPNADF
jgi:phospholipid-binding lipoprotein MlaA